MGNTKKSGATQLDERIKTKEPRKYAVIFHNDDYTPMDFVIGLLIQHFSKTPEEATHITLKVHTNQRAVVGVYPYEVAESKVYEVTQLAQSNNFPLNCTMEAV